MLAMDEEIEALWAQVEGWAWSRRPGVPGRAPGIPAAVADADRRGATDCSTLTAWMILSLYRGRIAEPDQLYRQLQIFDAARPWSPIEGVQRSGIGQWIGLVEACPGDWLLSQSWRGLLDGRVVSASRGHARLVRALPCARLRVLEVSQTARGWRDSLCSTSDVAGWGQTRFARLVRL